MLTLANWPLYTLEESFQGAIKRQGSPLLEHLLCLLFKKLREQLCVLLIIDRYPIICGWVHQQSTYAQLSPLYLLSTLYVTHVITYSRPSTAFPYCKQPKAGWGLGTRLSWYWVLQPSPRTSFMIVSHLSWIASVTEEGQIRWEFQQNKRWADNYCQLFISVSSQFEYPLVT